MIPGGVNELLLRSAAAGGATAGRSVRFNSADSAYLSRTPASAGNRKTWTWSLWAKLSGPYDATDDYLFYAYGSGTSQLSYFDFRWQSSSGNFYIGGYSTAWRVTTAVFRDPSAWYHIVLTWDTTQSTAADRIKLYVNGVQQTAFSSSSDPNLNDETSVSNTVQHRIGNTSNFYLALVHFIDGQALTPSSFGETSATTGQWIAKTYSGSYGTNGFFLDFLDNSTAAALGYDAAGSNDWTVNNLSVTAGSGNDSLRDHPTSAGTSTGLGGEVSGNYATLNPLTLTGSAKTYANGNLEVTATSNNNIPSVVSTFGARSGKWYAEVVAGWSASGIGFINADSVKDSIESSYGLGTPVDGWTRYGTYIFNNGVLSSGLTSIATNDLLQLALDLDNGKAWFGINGTWENSGNPANGTNPSVTFTPGGKTFLIGSCFRRDGTAVTMVHNYGARAFAYTAPSGFSPLVDTLLPTPTIAKPNTVMDVVLYTGNATNNRSVSGFSFSPDFVWIKSRSAATNHALYDTVRGAGLRLISNSTGAEADQTVGGLKSFTSDGFTLGINTTENGNGASLVSWAWDAGSSNATNTSGTITSTVRANISAGFSVVTWTGTGSAGTLGHGLGVAPQMIIVKNRSTASDWFVGHNFMRSTPWDNYYLILNSTSAVAGTIASWGGAGGFTPTSTLFGVGSASAVNNSGSNMVAYCWTPVAGYSAFGSYTGNGSANGPFVYTGFRPAYVLIKGSSSVTSWNIVDKQRLGYNADNYRLFAESSSAENATGILDFTANGFKIRNTGGDYNDNAQTYIYCAWAEAPFPYARAR